MVYLLHLQLGLLVTIAPATPMPRRRPSKFPSQNSTLFSLKKKAWPKLKTKTDKVDAKMLGQMGIERELFQWRRLSPNMRIIKQLTRDRVNLLNEKTMIINKMHALSYSFDPNKQVVKMTSR